jgi:hypothetical protein
MSGSGLELPGLIQSAICTSVVTPPSRRSTIAMSHVQPIRSFARPDWLDNPCSRQDGYGIQSHGHEDAEPSALPPARRTCWARARCVARIPRAGGCSSNAPGTRSPGRDAIGAQMGQRVARSSPGADILLGRALVTRIGMIGRKSLVASPPLPPSVRLAVPS